MRRLSRTLTLSLVSVVGVAAAADEAAVVNNLEISTPWNVTLLCNAHQCRPADPLAEAVYAGGSARSTPLLITDGRCGLPDLGQLLVLVQVQVALTALWGILAVVLGTAIQRWRTRPRRWNPQRTRARTRTRYNAEKDEVFFENTRGEVQPATNLERLQTYTSDLDEAVFDQFPSSSQAPMRDCTGNEIRLPQQDEEGEDELPGPKRSSCIVSVLSAITTLKFGNDITTAIAVLPTIAQFCVGIWLRARPGGWCPTVPRIAGWFGMLGVQSTIPSQVAATVIAFYPSRFLAPLIAVLALVLQCVWNGSLFITLGALASPAPGATSVVASCFRPSAVVNIAQGRIIAGIITEFCTVCATVMFAMHIRPRKRDIDMPLPISRIGLAVLVLILVGLQSTRAPVLTTAYPETSTLRGALRCAIDAQGLDPGYAVGRFIGLF